MQQVQLSYVERKPGRWYQHRWVYRLAIFLAILWAGWAVVRAVPPFWYRYRCFRLQVEAAQYPTSQAQVLLDYSPPGPAVSHAATSTIQFQNALWVSRNKAGLGTVTGTTLAGAPIFCHSLKTPKGLERVIQIYGQIAVAPGGTPTVNLLVTSCSILDKSWIFFPPDRSGNAGNALYPDVATGELQFPAVKSLTLSGGTTVPSDPSVVEMKLGVDGQTYPIRLHFVDSCGQSSFPGLAVEGHVSLLRTHICTGWGFTGFYEWPVAPASAGN